MEKDKLQIIKERFKLEGLTGDITEAGKKAGVSGTTVNNGLDKNSFKSLTLKERKGVLALLRILNNRKKEEEAIDAELNQ